MAESILRETHIEVSPPDATHEYPGFVFCVHMSRYLTPEELERIKLALNVTVTVAAGAMKA